MPATPNVLEHLQQARYIAARYTAFSARCKPLARVLPIFPRRRLHFAARVGAGKKHLRRRLYFAARFDR
jgi:hypothetical protein